MESSDAVGGHGPLAALMAVVGQVSSADCWQATTVALVAIVAIVAIVVGVPLGVAIGQTVWRAFATNLGVVPFSSVPRIADHGAGRGFPGGVERLSHLAGIRCRAVETGSAPESAVAESIGIRTPFGLGESLARKEAAAAWPSCSSRLRSQRSTFGARSSLNVDPLAA